MVKNCNEELEVGVVDEWEDIPLRAAMKDYLRGGHRTSMMMRNLPRPRVPSLKSWSRRTNRSIRQIMRRGKNKNLAV